MTAKIYYGEGVVTSIDHAYIDRNGDIIGGSLTPAIEIEGNVTSDEHVVVDFSTGKKQIKALIDDKEYGFDHKLWVGPFSEAAVTQQGDQITIETPKWKMIAPRNAVHLCDSVYYEDVQYEIAEYLDEKLENKYTINVVCKDLPLFSPTWYNNSFKAPFRYTHGLKSSTSWGCQNIAHGHYSYIEIGAEDQMAANALAMRIASDLDKKMFVWAENLVPNGVQYTTGRGMFSLSYRGTAMSHDVEILDTETTIENLVEWIYKRYEEELKKMWAYELLVSEGTQKGAKKSLSSWDV